MENVLYNCLGLFVALCNSEMVCIVAGRQLISIQLNELQSILYTIIIIYI